MNGISVHIIPGRTTISTERQGHVAKARAGRPGFDAPAGPSTRTRSSTPTRVLGALLAAVLGAVCLAGCSSTGGKRAEDRAKRLAANGSGVNTPRWTFAMVTHSGAGDTFWDIVQKGAKEASAKDNIKFLYSSSDQGNEQAQLVEAAIDQHVKGLIVTLAKPDAMKAVVQRAVKAGIPVITINSGSEQSRQFGALSHIGQDESIAGKAVGEELSRRGKKHALCVLHEQGNVGHEQRCAGVKETFSGRTDNLYVNGTNMPEVESAIQAKLQADKSIDSVVTLGAPFAATADKAKGQVGSSAEVVTFDLNAQVATSLKDGTISFAVDQQPYLQGYEAIDLLWLYRYNGDTLGGGEPVLTGPQIVTKDDADALLSYTKRGSR
jgi:simple sugar transport system substrate-binding protein